MENGLRIALPTTARYPSGRLLLLTRSAPIRMSPLRSEREVPLSTITMYMYAFFG